MPITARHRYVVFVVKRRWKLIVRPHRFECEYVWIESFSSKPTTVFWFNIFSSQNLGLSVPFSRKFLPNQRPLASGKFLAPTLRMPGGQRRRVLAQQGGRIPGFQTWEIHLDLEKKHTTNLTKMEVFTPQNYLEIRMPICWKITTQLPGGPKWWSVWPLFCLVF